MIALIVLCAWFALMSLALPAAVSLWREGRRAKHRAVAAEDFPHEEMGEWIHDGWWQR